MYKPKAKPGPKSIQQKTRAALLQLGWQDWTAQSRTGRYVTMKLPTNLPQPAGFSPIKAGSCLLLGPSGAIRFSEDGTLAKSWDCSEKAILQTILRTPVPGFEPPNSPPPLPRNPSAAPSQQTPALPALPANIEDLF